MVLPQLSESLFRARMRRTMPASPVVQDVAADALAARAIDRVLQAEREAREAVKACDRACAKML